MTLYAVIIAIETLAVFSPPPVAMTSDLMGGVYLATPNEIFHYSSDTLVESNSRYKESLLSGISDIAYSGQWIFVSLPMRGKIFQFDRYLRFVGEIETDNFFPGNIAVSADGSLWCFDPESKKIYAYSSVGDPIENYRVPGAADLHKPDFTGITQWNNLVHYLKTQDMIVAQTDIDDIGEIESPIIWSKSDNTIIAGIERENYIKINRNMEDLYIDNDNIYYITDSMGLVLNDMPQIDWGYDIPDDIIVYQRHSFSNIYTIIDNKLIKHLVQWKSQQ